MMKKLITTAVLSLQLVLPLSAVAQQYPFAGKPFTDVPKSSPFYEAIESLRESNILKGYEDGTFKPNQRISRAEFTMLATNPFFMSGERTNDCVRVNTHSGSTTIFFDDVEADAWYADAVCAGKTSEIINGYPDGLFRPNNTIILAEAGKIVAKVFVMSVRRDNSGVDEKWYQAYLQELAGRNAIPTSLTKVTQQITRGEMAEMLYRLKTQNQAKASTSWATLEAAGNN